LYHQYAIFLYWILFASLYTLYTKIYTKKWTENHLTVRGNNFIDSDNIDNDLFHATTLYNMVNIGLIIAFNYAFLFQLLFKSSPYIFISLPFIYVFISYLYIQINIKTIDYLNSCALKENYADLLKMSNSDVDFRLFFRYIRFIYIKYTWITFSVICFIQIIICIIVNKYFSFKYITGVYIDKIELGIKTDLLFYDGYIVYIPLIVLIIYQKFNDIVYKKWTIRGRKTVDLYIESIKKEMNSE